MKYTQPGTKTSYSVKLFLIVLGRYLISAPSQPCQMLILWHTQHAWAYSEQFQILIRGALCLHYHPIIFNCSTMGVILPCFSQLVKGSITTPWKSWATANPKKPFEDLRWAYAVVALDPSGFLTLLLQVVGLACISGIIATQRYCIQLNLFWRILQLCYKIT